MGCSNWKNQRTITVIRLLQAVFQSTTTITIKLSLTFKRIINIHIIFLGSTQSDEEICCSLSHSDGFIGSRYAFKFVVVFS
jgi:hypothetical protein